MSKTILITGASTGIGAETARILAEGDEIFVHYFSSKESAEGESPRSWHRPFGSMPCRRV